MFFRLWATPVPPVESSPTLGHAVLLFGLDPLDGPKDGPKKTRRNQHFGGIDPPFRE
jgi:hypothetical protein